MILSKTSPETISGNSRVWLLNEKLLSETNAKKGINIDEDLGSHTACTVGMWLYKTSTGGTYMFDFRANGGNWWLNNYNNHNFNIN